MQREKGRRTKRWKRNWRRKKCWRNLGQTPQPALEACFSSELPCELGLGVTGVGCVTPSACSSWRQAEGFSALWPPAGLTLLSDPQLPGPETEGTLHKVQAWGSEGPHLGGSEVLGAWGRGRMSPFWPPYHTHTQEGSWIQMGVHK